MSDVYPGSARLRARIMLYHPRFFPEPAPFLIFDAKFRTLVDLRQPIRCNLRYNIRFPVRTVLPGVYDVVAKVCM